MYPAYLLPMCPKDHKRAEWTSGARFAGAVVPCRVEPRSQTPMYRLLPG